MTDPSLPPIVDRALPSQSTFPIESAAPDPAQNAGSSGGVSSSRPLIFGMLFGVTGALGLPLLWTSPVFTRKEKWLWSLINILYTLGLIAIAVASLRVIFDAYEQLR